MYTSQNEMVLHFTQIGKGDVGAAGGKGANLGEMTKAGLAVPDGFVITSDAYRFFMRENSLDTVVSKKLEACGTDEGKLMQAAKSFRESIKAAVIPEALQAVILAEYQKLGQNARVAVRSSATAEDLPDASFAGQQETCLNVVGPDALLEQIRNCYASLWGNRAVAYRNNQGYDQNTVALAVVVQLMVESEKAGVLFTANPVNEDRNEMQINASYGLGESVVSGRVTADSYVCDKEGRLKSKTVGDKKTQIVYADKGTKEIVVSDEMREAVCLTDEEIRLLSQEAVKVEAYYGMPMDIEWAVAGGAVYILQARAITTLKQEKFDDSVIESYVKDCRSSGSLKENLAFLLEKIPAPFYPLDSHMVAAINNQKSNIFAENGIVISMQPRVTDDGITILPENGKKINSNIFHLFSLIRELKDYDHCHRKMEALMAKHAKKIEKIAKTDYEKLSLSDSVAAYKSIHDFVGRLAYDRFMYALFPGFFGNRKLVKYLKKFDENLTVYDLYSNLDYKTALVTKEFAKLAGLIESDEAVKQDVLADQSYEVIYNKYPHIRSAFDHFMDTFGFKSDFNCYCLYAKSFKEEPDRLLHIVKPLIGAERESEEQRFDQIMKGLKKRFSGARYEQLKKDIDHFRYFRLAREESQYYWETAFYYAKQALRQISRQLYGTDDFTGNVAYLFMEELLEVGKTGEVPQELQAKIDLRKKNRPLAYKVWDRCKLIVFGEATDVLKGVSGSRGETVGTARVIKSPEEFYKMLQGDILVCQYTDPEWTPLFKLASAVVADTGAALSHAAIVAREYGIPAVLGVGYATVQFQDGDTIRVNGTTGEVSKVGK